jgi:hypothetical protein
MAFGYWRGVGPLVCARNGHDWTDRFPEQPPTRSDMTRPTGRLSSQCRRADVNPDLTQIAERVIKRFEHELELKAQIKAEELP